MSSGDADGLRDLGRLLTTKRYGRAHEHHDVIGSTNDRAMQWAREGAPDGALVTAAAQTGGRGRHGRPWSSPAGGDIYASVVVRPADPPADLGALGLAVAVGLREGLPDVPGLALKWPNDVLVHGRKLAGILCETRWLGRRPEIVVGFGINVSRTEFPAELVDTATSLHLVLGAAAAPRPAPLLADVLASLEGVLDEFLPVGFAAVRARYEPHLTMLGRRIRLSRSGSEAEVIAEGLEDDGTLRVRPAAGGDSYTVSSADVWLGPGAGE